MRLKIVRDDCDAQNPRKEWDNLGTMVCWHRHYILGDEQERDLTMEAFLSDLPKGSVVLPVYMYDHSGITIKTTPFNDRFDSGLLGFIYVTPDKIRKEYNVKRISQATRDKVEKVLIDEVKIYDAYLRGEVWGFVLEKNNGDHIDSCFGFFGDDKDGIKWHLPKRARKLLDEAWENRG